MAQILREKVEYKKKTEWPSAGVVCADLRITNLIGSMEKESPFITGKTSVVRRGKDIVITRKVDGLVTYVDYSPELYHVLNSYGALHTKANDKRLSLCIDGKHDVYLYHLRMIEHLYGLPKDTEGLIANIDRFRAEQLGQDYIVDHIDNDSTNDRLSNLMLITTGQAALVGLSAAGILKGFTMIANGAKNAYGDVLKLSTAFDIMGKAKGVGVTADQMQTLISVTKGLSESQLRLVVSNKALTNEQRMAILTSSGLTKEQAAQTLATMGLATAETTATAATFSLSGAMKALGAAIMANPIGFLATALTIAVSVIQTATDAAKEAKQALIETGKEAVQSAEDLTELINSYIELERHQEQYQRTVRANG